MKSIHTVAALGPAGTNGHQAALMACEMLRRSRTKMKIVFCQRNQDVLEMAAENGCYGVVPIENSTEGLVMEVIKGFWIPYMRQPVQKVFVIGEIDLPIQHCLLVQKRVKDVKEIKQAISHPQALGQCKGFLDSLGIKLRVPEKSTAYAAKLVASSEKYRDTAAIASSFAAEIYGLSVLRSDIQDSDKNETRFHIVGPFPVPKNEHNTTALIFRVSDEPRALLNALWAISVEDVNLSAIHSIPLGSPGQYAFYCEFEEHIESDAGKRIIDRMRTVTQTCDVLGSYS